jgi:hypothetical protein
MLSRKLSATIPSWNLFSRSRSVLEDAMEKPDRVGCAGAELRDWTKLAVSKKTPHSAKRGKLKRMSPEESYGTHGNVTDF